MFFHPFFFFAPFHSIFSIFFLFFFFMLIARVLGGRRGPRNYNYPRRGYGPYYGPYCGPNQPQQRPQHGEPRRYYSDIPGDPHNPETRAYPYSAPSRPASAPQYGYSDDAGARTLPVDPSELPTSPSGSGASTIRVSPPEGHSGEPTRPL